MKEYTIGAPDLRLACTRHLALRKLEEPCAHVSAPRHIGRTEHAIDQPDLHLVVDLVETRDLDTHTYAKQHERPPTKITGSSKQAAFVNFDADGV